jgi:hypothetical protein
LLPSYEELLAARHAQPDAAILLAMIFPSISLRACSWFLKIPVVLVRFNHSDFGQAGVA